MKKFVVLLLALAMVLALAGCGVVEALLETTEEATVETTEEVTVATTEATEAAEEPIFATLEAKKCFYDAGFVELIDGTSESAMYTFTAEDSEAVEWWIYVLDESFEEGLRYIKQVAEPVLKGDGEVLVESGKYIYIYCSANEFTTGVVDENAKLNITVK